MSGTLTNAGAIRIISGGSIKSGATHVALYTADPGDAGSHANEVATGTGYSRQAITWTSSGGLTESNVYRISFTASGSWGNVTHWALVTNGTRGSGLALMHGPLSSSRAMSSGNQIRFLPGSLGIEGITT